MAEHELYSMLFANIMFAYNLQMEVYLFSPQGFFCKEEKDFDNWCSLVQKVIMHCFHNTIHIKVCTHCFGKMLISL